MTEKKRRQEQAMLGLIALGFSVILFYLGPGSNISMLLYASFFLLIAFGWRFFQALHQIQNGTNYQLALPHIFVLISLVWICLSITWSQLPSNSFYFAWEYSFFALGFFVLVSCPDGVWQRLIPVLFLPLLFSALWGLIEFQQTLVRANGPLIDPNLWAALNNMGFFGLATLYLGSPENRRMRDDFWKLLFLFIFALALFAAYSRVATVVHFAALSVMVGAGCFSSRYRKKALILVGVSLLSLVLIHQMATTEVASHDEGFTLRQEARGWTERRTIWSSALAISKDYPVLGSGFATFKALYPAYRTEGDLNTLGNFVHNDYLQVLTEGGPVSLALFLIFVAYLLYWLGFYLRDLLKKKNASHAIEAIGLILAMGTALTHALMSFIVLQACIFMLLGVFFARLVSLNGHQSMASFSVNHPGLLKVMVPFVASFLWALLLMDSMAFGIVYNQKGIPFIDSMRENPEMHLGLMQAFKKFRSNNPVVPMDLARIYEASIKGQTNQKVRDTLAYMSANEFEQALEDNPYNLGTLYFYADLLEAHPWLQKMKELKYTPEQIYNHGIEVAPTNVQSWTRKAAYLEKLGKDREAFNLLLKALPWANVRASGFKGRRLEMLTLLSRLARRLDDKKVLETISKML